MYNLICTLNKKGLKKVQKKVHVKTVLQNKFHFHQTHASFTVIFFFNFKLVLNFNEEFKTLYMHFARALYEALVVRNGFYKRSCRSEEVLIKFIFIQIFLKAIESIPKLNNLYTKNVRPAIQVGNET